MEIVNKRNVFLGITNNNELAFGQIEVRHPSYYSKEKGHYVDESRLDFSCSFDTSSIFNKSKYINSGEFERDVENYVECEMDGDTKLHLLEQWDCPMSELAEKLSEEETVENWIDNSCFPLSIEVDGDEYIFRSEAGGQHDLREDGMKLYTDKDMFYKIMNMWDENHLKEISQKEADALFKEIDKSISNGDLISEDDSKKMEEFLTFYIKDMNKENDIIL